MANPRLCALEALRRTRKDAAFSNIVLDAVLQESDLNRGDRAFATAIYYGVLERSKTLDYMISKLCNSGSNKIAPMVAECLRIGLYQIKYMDKVPQSAAVNETVKMVRKKCTSATGFVNAILRRACREDIALPQGDTPEDMSILYSCDVSIAECLIKDLGIGAAREFLKASLEAAPIYIRVNTLKITPEELVEKLNELGIEAKKTNIPEALMIKGIGSVEKNPLYAEGLFHVEDLAAQWAVKSLCPKSGERVLDMCSAPGGKAFSAAEYMGDKGEIKAFDLYENRVGLIQSGAERLGISIISASSGDSSVFNESLGEFDAVLCDVPCSGIGIIRRKPDIKYKSVSDFGSLPELQYSILSNGARYLKKGGRLVYSTCTLRKEENGEVAARFLKEHPEFKPLKVDIGGEKLSEKTFLPQNDETDGFYVAVFIKE